jgi:hypothetical protein
VEEVVGEVADAISPASVAALDGVPLIYNHGLPVAALQWRMHAYVPSSDAKILLGCRAARPSKVDRQSSSFLGLPHPRIPSIGRGACNWPLGRVADNSMNITSEKKQDYNP